MKCKYCGLNLVKTENGFFKCEHCESIFKFSKLSKNELSQNDEINEDVKDENDSNQAVEESKEIEISSSKRYIVPKTNFEMGFEEKEEISSKEPIEQENKVQQVTFKENVREEKVNETKKEDLTNYLARNSVVRHRTSSGVIVSLVLLIVMTVLSITASGYAIFKLMEDEIKNNPIVSMYSGTTAPSNNKDYKVGDFYINTENGKMYVKTRDGWDEVELMANKDNEYVSSYILLSGEGEPNQLLGKNGNFYVDTITRKLYSKVDGAWNEIKLISEDVEKSTILVGDENPNNKPDDFGKIGDFYVDSENNLYKKVLKQEEPMVTEWVIVLSGGIQRASLIVNGQGHPSVVGDIDEDAHFYLDTDAQKLYIKDGDNWNLVLSSGIQSMDEFLVGTNNPNDKLDEVGGNIGDFYIDSQNYNIYKKISNEEWKLVLSGGIQDVELIFVGEGNPNEKLDEVGGKVGDYYIDTLNNNIYKKTGENAWSLVLSGGVQEEKQTLFGEGSPIENYTQGKEGDLYIDTKNNCIYQKDSTTWVLKFAQGIILNGEGEPNVTIGKNGDFYLDTLNQKLYLKNNLGQWNVVLQTGLTTVPTFYVGEGEPNDLHYCVGDFYIDSTNNVIYHKNNTGHWYVVFDGGAQKASYIISGYGNPNDLDNLDEDADYFIDLNSNILYKKNDDDSWSVAINGNSAIDEQGLHFYAINGGREYACTLGLSGVNETVTVPAYHNGKPVTRLASNLLQVSNYYITRNLYLPNTLTMIENGVLNNIKGRLRTNNKGGVAYLGDGTNLYLYAISYLNAQSITLDSTCRGIAPFAFQNTGNLFQITLSDSLVFIGFGAFDNSAISSIHIPNTVQSIEEAAFRNTYNMQSCTFEENSPISIIAFDTFYRSAIKSITIPKLVRASQAGAFMESQIESVYFEDDSVFNMFCIESFYNCYNLEYVQIPQSLRYITDNVFYNCHNLTTIDGLENVQNVEIAQGAFRNCINLKSINLGKVTQIGNYAFSDCYSLEEVMIDGRYNPQINDYVFEYCYSLSNIYYVGKNENLKINSTTWGTIENITHFIYFEHETYSVAINKNKTILPSLDFTPYQYQFTSEDTDVAEVELSTGKLTTKSNVAQTKINLVLNCSEKLSCNLSYTLSVNAATKTLEFDFNGGRDSENNTSKIENFAEDEVVTFEDFDVSNAGYELIGWDANTDVEYPTYYKNAPREFVFEGSNAKLYAVWRLLPGFYAQNGSLILDWQGVLDRGLLTCENNVLKAMEYNSALSNFESSNSVYTIVLDNNITAIESYPFGYGGTNAKVLKLPLYLNHLNPGEYGCNFYGATNIEELYFSENVTTISGFQLMTFGSIPNIERIKIDERNPVYSDEGCNVIYRKADNAVLAGIGTSTIPENTVTIKTHSFSYVGLETLYIPASVTTIENYAFIGCDALEEIMIEGKNSPIINAYAFYYCSSLSNVYYIGKNENLRINSTMWEKIKNITHFIYFEYETYSVAVNKNKTILPSLDFTPYQYQFISEDTDVAEVELSTGKLTTKSNVAQTKINLVLNCSEKLSCNLSYTLSVEDATKTLEFDFNGGRDSENNTSKTENFAQNEIVTFEDFDVSKTGYELIGWDANTDVEYPTYYKNAPREFVFEGSSAKLYAVWRLLPGFYAKNGSLILDWQAVLDRGLLTCENNVLKAMEYNRALSNFESSSSVYTIVFDNNITAIESYPFGYGGTRAKIFKLPLYLSVLNPNGYGYNFYSASNIEELHFSENLTTINNGHIMASGTSMSLKTIKIDKRNPVYSDEGCNVIYNKVENALLTTIKTSTIPENTLIIKSYALRGDMTTINIPASVRTIESNPLMYNGSIQSITVDSDNPYYDSRNNCNAIIRTNTNTLIAGCLTTVIPEGVVSIASNSFTNLQIKKMVIPSTLKTIQSSAFQSCSQLKNFIVVNRNAEQFNNEVSFPNKSSFSSAKFDYIYQKTDTINLNTNESISISNLKQIDGSGAIQGYIESVVIEDTEIASYSSGNITALSAGTTTFYYKLTITQSTNSLLNGVEISIPFTLNVS